MPEIFTGHGLKCLFDNITNTKHRVLLKMIYACGLRRGEVRNIRLIDIQRKNMHVLPEGFVKVRHYGVCSNRIKMKVRELVYAGQDLEPPEIRKGLSWVEVYMEVHGAHPKLCPECKSAVMVNVQVLPPIRDGPSVCSPTNHHALKI